MSKNAWCDLNSKGNLIKLHDKSPKCTCQKLITFIPNHIKLKGGSIKSKLQKNFRGAKNTWDSFIRPGLKMSTPLMSVAIAAKTKNPQSA